MIIEFVDPGLDFFWFFVCIGIGLALFAVVFIIAMVTKYAYPQNYRDAWDGWLTGITIGATFVSVVLAGLGTMSLFQGYNNRVYDAQVVAMEEAGFEHIDWLKKTSTSGDFTASWKGQYFKGLLVSTNPEHDYRYQVVELDQ